MSDLDPLVEAIMRLQKSIRSGLCGIHIPVQLNDIYIVLCALEIELNRRKEAEAELKMARKEHPIPWDWIS